MQTLIDKSMLFICEEEGVSPEQVFFVFLCCLLYHYGLSERKSFVVIKNKITYNFLTLEF